MVLIGQKVDSIEDVFRTGSCSLAQLKSTATLENGPPNLAPFYFFLFLVHLVTGAQLSLLISIKGLGPELCSNKNCGTCFVHFIIINDQPRSIIVQSARIEA